MAGRQSQIDFLHGGHVTTFDSLLDSYRQLADSERMKGNYFEQLVEQYLENDGVQSPQYKDVYLWRDWPGRNGLPDTGIDLVAERVDGGVTAIQCKFYADTHVMQKRDIDSFIAASGRKPFTHRLVISTTPHWSSNAEEMLDSQHIPVQRISLSDFRHSNIDWSTYTLTDPGNAPQLHDKNQLRPHQHDAVMATLKGFEDHDRGKLIMACGTGKTFTALKIAERFAETEGHARILFLVPSLALMSQSLKEWSDQTEQPMHAYAVCSDTKVGRQKNADLTDVAIHDLQIPATTDGKTLVEAMGRKELDEGMTVVFSTYQSIDAVAEAQRNGLPDFDLIICDEAHRTTGATVAGTEESHFVKVHRNDVIAGARRLYMTATPRLFNDNTKDAAREKDAVLCSMDDEDLYGPVFHRIGFGEAVIRELLSDYKVLVLGVEQSQVVSSFQNQLADGNMELQIDDVAKLIGCWNGLAKRRSGSSEVSFGTDVAPMKRAVAFNRDIKASKLIESEFEDLVRVHLVNEQNEDATDDLKVQVKHIDGGFNAVARAERLDWLKEEVNFNGGSPVCRILTNARCLTEGVDVPSLDAVLFMNPRNSMVDVIQAVGRVMRRSEGKQFGYIILPIAIPDGMSTSEALRDNERYKVVWQVLQALRAHDERMDAAINQIELNKRAPESIIIDTVDLKPKKPIDLIDDRPSPSEQPAPTEPERPDAPMLQFPVEEWKDSVYAKIVDKCGNRMYWADWSKDIAEIATKHIALINNLLEQANSEHRKAFDDFIAGLQENLNPDIDQAQAVEMLAQHLVTKPVFDAMFTDSNFTEHNPVSLAMQNILNQLDDHSAFEKERAGLEKFYNSVRARVKSIDNAAAKQKIILELYDNFFRAAFPRVADRLGIVFTPVPVVDYILRSADAALRLEFGKSLSDEGVSILEPFVGTGTFVTRLLQTGLIKPEDLHRKYTQELFANEIVLLSYYIAAINIETVFAEESARHGLNHGYVPFEGIALTDTFQLNESDGAFESAVFPENSERVQRQKRQDIRVIVMNPPYSGGQTSANDNNKNQGYPLLDASISDTYAKRSTATLKNSLYDSYIRGIRWASNRVKENGIIAFVSNGSFIDGNTADGLRKTLAAEFSRIFIYNLRGNQRTSGEVSRREGGKIFGSGSRTQVAIAILIKNSSSKQPVEIQYRDIGDNLTREQKLDILEIEQSLIGTDWDVITPNDHGDWIDHRNQDFGAYQPLGDKATKGKSGTPAVFVNYTGGLATNRDAWVYNFSKQKLITNVERMIGVYESERSNFATQVYSGSSVDEIWASKVTGDPRSISWSRGLRGNLQRGRSISFAADSVTTSAYRPFNRQIAYFNSNLNENVGQLPKMFPTPNLPNLGFYVPGIGAKKPFSVLAVNRIPDLNMWGSEGGQFFSLYTYESVGHESQTALLVDDEGIASTGYRRIDNITDATQSAYRNIYGDSTLGKEDIFFYVYALLHSPEYREAYRSDLVKMLPRIPRVKDFWGFAAAGRQLADLHLNYENVTPYPLQEILSSPLPHEEKAQYDFFRVNKMSFGARKDRSRIIYNSHITLEGIPASALDYQLTGKSALEWILDRYQVTTHKDSKITNDPNDYSREVGDPRYILDLLKRIVTVSVKTNEIVAALPALDVAE